MNRTILVVAALSATSAHAADLHLPLQGRLLDAAGGAIGGTRDLAVYLVDGESTPTTAAAWSGAFPGVPLTDGYFSLVLSGGAPPLTAALLADGPMWAVVTVDGVELSRQALGDAPTAGVASIARGVRTGALDSVSCGVGAEGELLAVPGGGLFVCLGAGGWASVGGSGGAVGIENVSGTRRFADGTPARSCHDYRFPPPGYAYVGDVGSGMYAIDRSTGGADGATVYCDMETAGGGWTLIQRTIWAWAGSNNLSTTMAEVVTATINTADSASAYRMRADLWPWVSSRDEMMIKHHVRNTDGSTCPTTLEYVSRFDALTVSSGGISVSGYANLGATNLNSSVFTARDIGPSLSCTSVANSSAANGVPWFYGSCCSLCPTYKGGYWTDEPHPMWYPGSAGAYSPDVDGQDPAAVCPNRRMAVGNEYIGDNRMEVFLR